MTENSGSTTIPTRREAFYHQTSGTIMVQVSDNSIRRGLVSCLTVLAVLNVAFPGCLTTSMIEEKAAGEPKEGVYFALSASVDAYEITRWWDSGRETLSVPRRDLPWGCNTARFFLNDPTHELQIAQPVSANWVTGERLPLPDDGYPPCALLVTYGSFSEPQALEGLSVSSATGLVATGERKQPTQAAWALAPAGLAADVFLFVGALVTMPVWAPVGLIAESSAANEKREQDAEAKGALPPLVAACWTAMESAMEKGGSSNPDQPFVRFEWVPGRANAYAVATANEVFSDDKPVSIDARVTLSQGRVQFRIGNWGSLWTDADVECGLQAGEVVATCVKPRK